MGGGDDFKKGQSSRDPHSSGATTPASALSSPRPSFQESLSELEQLPRYAPRQLVAGVDLWWYSVRLKRVVDRGRLTTDYIRVGGCADGAKAEMNGGPCRGHQTAAEAEAHFLDHLVEKQLSFAFFQEHAGWVSCAACKEEAPWVTALMTWVANRLRREWAKNLFDENTWAARRVVRILNVFVEPFCGVHSRRGLAGATVVKMIARGGVGAVGKLMERS